MPKSKSTPVGLTDKTKRSPHKRPTIRPRADKSKSHSVGNISNEKDKVRLQVVYKPPFKFSVKLRKPEKTSVIIERVPDAKKSSRTGVMLRSPVKEPLSDVKDSNPSSNDPNPPVIATEEPALAPPIATEANPPDIDSNIHTVQSDLEVLLSESEYLFSDD